MSERRRLLMAQGEEDNPWEKIDYLTFVPLEGTLRLKISHAFIVTYEYDEELDEEYENYSYCEFEYSLDDGKTWRLSRGGDDGYIYISVAEGQTLKIKADIDYFFYGEEGDLYSMSFMASKGKYAVAGTPMSLLASDINSMLNAQLHWAHLNYCFSELFQGDSNLVKILNPKTFLPATRLGEGNYANMFYSCGSLVNAPELPATSIDARCYSYMFYKCSSLKNPPDLPSTQLEYDCYSGMFRECTSLIKAPKLPAKALAAGCYERMFRDCSSLVEAPEISAENIASRCCIEMFYNCKSLKYIKAMFKQPYAPSVGYTTNWVYGVSPTGTFVKNKNATWNVTGVHGIPTGWTVITE